MPNDQQQMRMKNGISTKAMHKNGSLYHQDDFITTHTHKKNSLSIRSRFFIPFEKEEREKKSAAKRTTHTQPKECINKAKTKRKEEQIGKSCAAVNSENDIRNSIALSIDRNKYNYYPAKGG